MNKLTNITDSYNNLSIEKEKLSDLIESEKSFAISLKSNEKQDINTDNFLKSKIKNLELENKNISEKYINSIKENLEKYEDLRKEFDDFIKKYGGLLE